MIPSWLSDSMLVSSPERVADTNRTLNRWASALSRWKVRMCPPVLSGQGSSLVTAKMESSRPLASADTTCWSESILPVTVTKTPSQCSTRNDRLDKLLIDHVSREAPP